MPYKKRVSDEYRQRRPEKSPIDRELWDELLTMHVEAVKMGLAAPDIYKKLRRGLDKPVSKIIACHLMDNVSGADEISFPTDEALVDWLSKGARQYRCHIHPEEFAGVIRFRNNRPRVYKLVVS